MILLLIYMKQEITDIDDKNITGFIVDTRDNKRYSGDYEWIAKVENSRIVSGICIMPQSKNGTVIDFEILMGNSHLSTVEEFLETINQKDIVGYANTKSEVITQINKFTSR